MKIKIILGFKDLSNAEAVIEGDKIADGIVDNPYFTDVELQAKGVLVATASDKLRDALDLPKSPTRTSTLTMAREKWETEVSNFTARQEVIINEANVTYEEKIKMAESANRQVVEHTPRQKYTFDVKRGEKKNQVVFTGTTKDAVAHAYTWTKDLVNFTAKADPVLSASAKTTADDVPSGELAFFHKGIYFKKSMDWEGPIYLTVV